MEWNGEMHTAHNYFNAYIIHKKNTDINKQSKIIFLQKKKTEIEQRYHTSTVHQSIIALKMPAYVFDVICNIILFSNFSQRSGGGCNL